MKAGRRCGLPEAGAPPAGLLNLIHTTNSPKPFRATLQMATDAHLVVERSPSNQGVFVDIVAPGTNLGVGLTFAQALELADMIRAAVEGGQR